MTFKSFLKKLERKKLISRKPYPIAPFILAISSYLLYLTQKSVSVALSTLLLILSMFSLLFAILHLIIYKALSKR